MLLRHKFALVALAYLLSLVVNLALSAWCIVVYFNSAFGEFEELLAHQELIEQVRGGLRQQAKDLAQHDDPAERRRAYASSQQQLGPGLRRILSELTLPPDLTQDLRAAVRQKEEAVAPYLEPGAGSSIAESDHRVFQELDRLLGQGSRIYSGRRDDRVRRTAVLERRVITLLTFSASLGAVLCLGSLIAMRRWVVQPVNDLRIATREISQGRFEHRVNPRAGDELGRLASEVNQMCQMILSMQRRLIDRERLAAAGEMVTRVAHNIRNPLSGIRALAEATSDKVPQDAEVLEYQRRIMEAIDRLEQWLGQLQHSVAPLALKPTRVDLQELLDGVAAAVNGMLLGRKVELSVEVSPEARWVRVDPLHFEQAVVAILTNAVQASPPGQCVRITAGPAEEGPADWQLAVEDHGPGIAPELLDSIFSAYFTTKADGTGLGLAIAQKVIRLHGGELAVKSKPGEGSRFTAVLPGRLIEEAHGRDSDHR